MYSAERYLQEGHWEKVPGATSLENLQFIFSLARFQEQLGLSGDLGEIGVYMGRVFILLHLLSRVSEAGIAIDVFDDAASNFDVTGGATSLAAFQEHVRQNVSSRDFKRVRILKANSLYLSATDLRQRMLSDAFRILSIDGAHSWYHTVSDLTLADSVIQPGGVVIVDDITNSGWPGVMEGVARYLLLSPKRRLFPFAIGRNKLWLTTPEYHELYLNQAMSDANPVYAPYEKRMSEFCGTKVAGF